MESAYVKNCFDRRSPSLCDFDYAECVVAMHVPPIKGTAQVKFKVLDGTEPTLSMPMLVANGNRLVYRGEDTMLSTAAGEVVPLMNDGYNWYLKVLINNSNEFIRIDVWTPCHVCPPSWVRNLSPEMKERERYIVREQTSRKEYENSRKSMQLSVNRVVPFARSERGPVDHGCDTQVRVIRKCRVFAS